jgi:hypothetical protein
VTQVLRCDACRATAPPVDGVGWIHTSRQTLMFGEEDADFCSWRCLNEYASQKCVTSNAEQEAAP